MADAAKFTTINGYLATVSPGVRGVLEEVRRIVNEEVPAAVETIGYKMPAFKVERIFLYVAAFKKHVGIYPPVKGGAVLEKKLAPYAGSKGNLKFPLDQPIPFDLIRQVVRRLAGQYARR